MDESNFPKFGTKFLPYIKNVWIFIPAFIYIFMAFHYSVNIPCQDDYDAVLKFLTGFKKAPFIDKISLLFSQHNEHRIFSSRVVYVVYYYLFGNINFKSLLLIANLQLVFIFIILVYFVRNLLPQSWKTVSFIIGLCLCDLNNWENGGFAMAAMQNYGVIMFFCASILFYSLTNRKYIILAALIQAIAIFSSGNGVLAGLFVVVFTVLMKDKIKIGTAVLVSLIFSPLYFWHYVTVSTGHPSHDFFKVILFFFRLAGAHFRNPFPLATGILITLFVIILTPMGNRLRNIKLIPFLCILSFAIISVGIVSVYRVNISELSWTSSRYFIYPHLIAATLFVFFMDKYGTTKKVLSKVVVIVFLIVYIVNFQEGRVGFSWRRSVLKETGYHYPDQNMAKKIEQESCQSGIYCIEGKK